MLRPFLLTADNFTPSVRTPWGGRRIVGQYKAALPECAPFTSVAVGESWELSLGPELPSRLEDGRWLHDVVLEDAAEQLGAEAHRGGSALLVKWLDAADALSVQIHPDVDDRKLAADETGKPECWYVVAREPGAGLYLGLRPGVSEPAMRSALLSDADVAELLEFVPVEPGDFFLLSPGLPHAVGAGVTLIEPQYVSPGKKAVTLRYWDWNRRYDANGKRDAHGEPRVLHVERALGVTHWHDASNPEFLAKLRCSLGPCSPDAPVRIDVLAGPDAAARVTSPHLRAAAVRGTGEACLPPWPTLRGLTVISGSITLHGAFGELCVPSGRTAVVGAALGAVHFRATAAHALVSSVVA